MNYMNNHLRYQISECLFFDATLPKDFESSVNYIFDDLEN